MAEDLDVEAMLEAPYRKEVGKQFVVVELKRLELLNWMFEILAEKILIQLARDKYYQYLSCMFQTCQSLQT